MRKTYAPYTTPERLMESMHTFHTQTNEALNSVIAKYAPKNRTYGTTMSLSNRIAIVIGIHNMGHLAYWSEVFKRVGLGMPTDLLENLERLDHVKSWKRKYNSAPVVKQKRVKARNEKMQTLLKQQKKDHTRGAIYSAGYAVKDPIPKAVKNTEDELRHKGKVKCKLYGCHGKNHKTNASKRCMYYGCDTDVLGESFNEQLQRLYPQHFCVEISDPK